MGMTLLTDIGQLQLQIMQLGERAAKGMSERMRKHAILIRDLAREYAPVKTGLLEENIDYRTIKDGRRNAYVVFVNVDAERIRVSQSGVTQDTLGDYAMLMERDLRPYGAGIRFKKLGVRSARKRASGKKVGGRFLDRAIKDGTKTLMPDLVDAVRRVTGGGGRSYNDEGIY